MKIFPDFIQAIIDDYTYEFHTRWVDTPYYLNPVAFADIPGIRIWSRGRDGGMNLARVDDIETYNFTPNVSRWISHRATGYMILYWKRNLMCHRGDRLRWTFALRLRKEDTILMDYRTNRLGIKRGNNIRQAIDLETGKRTKWENNTKCEPIPETTSNDGKWSVNLISNSCQIFLPNDESGI